MLGREVETIAGVRDCLVGGWCVYDIRSKQGYRRTSYPFLQVHHYVCKNRSCGLLGNCAFVHKMVVSARVTEQGWIHADQENSVLWETSRNVIESYMVQLLRIPCTENLGTNVKV